VNAIVLSPLTFLFGIVAKLGIYGSDVLLIREAKVRWQKGWATVLLFLGADCGILEEGIASCFPSYYAILPTYARA